jgi:two-component system, OmpR family, response regulator
VSVVLVVEDDPDMRELERRALSYAGHDVLVAENGHEALRALETHRPAVIVLDVMMPGMDGLTFLLERMRRGIAVEVPVVCVSAGGPAVAGEALRLGAAEFVGKPVSLEDLCDRVADYCNDAA